MTPDVFSYALSSFQDLFKDHRRRRNTRLLKACVGIYVDITKQLTLVLFVETKNG